MLAELRAQFPFGVILVTDDKSTEPIPDWSSDEQQVTSTATAMVMKIRHEADGPAVVRIWDEAPPSAGKTEHDPISLKVPSGLLRISTATGEHAVRVLVPGGSARIGIRASAARDPGEIDLVVVPGSPTRERARAVAPAPAI